MSNPKKILSKLLNGQTTVKTVTVDLEGFDDSLLCDEQIISFAHLLRVGMRLTTNNKQLFPDDKLEYINKFKNTQHGFHS